jgi:hypothetical protein
MVRRDADRSRAVGRRSARCVSPAGASPAPASVGAPGSRPQVAGRDPHARAGRRKLARRREPRSEEQARGPQHEVKPAASTEEQSGGRAGHFTAKATPSARAPKRVDGSGGVGGAAREQGEVRNTRGPSSQPVSGRGGSYKPKAKSSVAERESEGAVVVTMLARRTTRAERRAPAAMMPSEQVSAREWPPRADLTTPSAVCRAKKCDDCNDGCVVRPSKHQVGASMRCMGSSAGVTSCAKHGGA